MLESGFTRGTIDKTLFYLKKGKDLLLVQIYVDDIIFGSTNDKLCQKFSKISNEHDERDELFLRITGQAN